jgi:hypothetical protein
MHRIAHHDVGAPLCHQRDIRGAWNKSDDAPIRQRQKDVDVHLQRTAESLRNRLYQREQAGTQAAIMRRFQVCPRDDAVDLQAMQTEIAVG